MGLSLALSRITGLEVPSIQFLVCQFAAIIFGLILRYLYPPSLRNSKQRHFFELFIGIIILYTGYGSAIIHLFAQAVPAYLMLVLLPLPVAQYGILIFSLIYLSAVHISLLSSNGSVDISSPLMIQTQKLSSLAFNINDGVKLAAGMPVIRESHKLNSINRRPRLLQLGGYLFCFHNCMIGPFMFFAEYLRFIEGRESDALSDPEQRDRFDANKEELRLGKAELWKQLKLLLLHTCLFLWAQRNFKADSFLGDEFRRKNLLHKYLFLLVACFGFRQRFYFGWTLSCITNLAAGCGFSGFSAVDGSPEYRLANNIHFFAIELGTNTKTILDSWNTATTRWLRECVYDRVPRRFAVWAVFVASAVWHGFHPGYYLAFVSAALITVTGRYARRYLRPHFLGSPTSRFFYDVLTHLCAMFCLNYLGVAFLLKSTNKVLYFWLQLRFLGHLGPLLLLMWLQLVSGSDVIPQPEPAAVQDMTAARIAEPVKSPHRLCCRSVSV